mgnify:CR=1 FL=1
MISREFRSEIFPSAPSGTKKRTFMLIPAENRQDRRAGRHPFARAKIGVVDEPADWRGLPL